MGLDMFLKKKLYIGANYEHNKIGGKIALTKDKKPIPIKLNEINEIILWAGYWRKANAIHKWFVDNCQDGEDDCKEYEVSLEKLKELLDLCQKIKEKPELAPELLPTEGGFFFGSTDYDEYYLEDINSTIGIINQILEGEKERPEGIFYEYAYRASW